MSAAGAPVPSGAAPEPAVPHAPEAGKSHAAKAPSGINKAFHSIVNGVSTRVRSALGALWFGAAERPAQVVGNIAESAGMPPGHEKTPWGVLGGILESTAKGVYSVLKWPFDKAAAGIRYGGGVIATAAQAPFQLAGGAIRGAGGAAWGLLTGSPVEKKSISGGHDESPPSGAEPAAAH